MKKSKFTEEQIIGFLNEAEAGVPVKDLCRKHGFSAAAFYGWRTKFRGMNFVRGRQSRSPGVSSFGSSHEGPFIHRVMEVETAYWRAS